MDHEPLGSSLHYVVGLTVKVIWEEVQYGLVYEVIHIAGGEGLVSDGLTTSGHVGRTVQNLSIWYKQKARVTWFHQY